MADSDIDITDLLSSDDENENEINTTSKPIVVDHSKEYNVTDDRSLVVGFPQNSQDIIVKTTTNSKIRFNTKKSRPRPRTAKTRTKHKPKVRTRPQSAASNSKALKDAMRKFEELQKAQSENKKPKKNARYSPNQWFDSNIIKGVEDFREENYRLRQDISNYKKETMTLKSQIKGLEKQNLKRSKEIQALITVAIENNKNNKTEQNKTGKTNKKKKKIKI